MNFNFEEKAIPLVQIDDQGKFQVNENAINILKNIEGPIAVVGVAGLYRTGKSFLLNRIILNREDGFGVAPTINACTKGIWIWGKPIKSQNENGDIINYIVLDSEGLGALDQDSAHDCRIFALVLLLSSIFIFNSVGTIDENSISNLSLVINLTKHIQTKIKQSSLNSEDDFDDSEEFEKFFPSFIWVLRDFSLQLSDEYGDEISPKQYLENALKQQDGLSEDILQKNRIRRLIHTFFRQRNCFPLVRPLMDENELQQLSKVKISDLRSEFVDQMFQLRELVLKNGNVKKMHGQNINGEMLGGLLISYVQAINEGAVPNIESAWTYVCQTQNEKILKIQIEEFKSNIEEQLEDNIPLNEEEIKIYLKEQKQKIVNILKEKLMTKKPEEFLDRFQREYTKQKQQLLKDNKFQFENVLQDILEQNYQRDIQQNLLDNNFDSYSSFIKQIKVFKDQMLNINIEGPNKKQLINEFLIQKLLEAINLMSQNMEEENLKKIHNLEKNIIDYDSQVQQAKNNLLLAKQDYLNKLKQLEDENIELTSEKESLQKNFNLIKKEKDENQQNFEIKFQEMRNIFQKDIENQKVEIQNLEYERNKIQNQIIQQKADYETEIALLKQKIDIFKNIEEDYNNLRKKMIEKQSQIEAQNMQSVGQLKNQYEQQIQDLNETIHDLKQQNMEFQEDCNQKLYQEQSKFLNFEQKEDELKDCINQHENTILDLQQTIKDKDQNINYQELEDLQVQIQDLQQQLKDKSYEIQKLNDNQKMIQMNLEKEQAIIKQNKEFYDIKLNDLQKENQELKKMRMNTLNEIEDQNNTKQASLKLVQELTDKHQKQIDALNQDYQLEKQEIIEKFEQIIEESEQNFKNLKKEKDEFQKQYLDLKQDMVFQKNENNKLKEQNEQSELNRQNAIQKLEEHYKKQIQELEQNIEQEIQNKESEFSKQKILLNQDYNEMKEFFENQKNQIIKQKDQEIQKYQEKYKILTKENEERFTQEKDYMENIIDNLRKDLEDKENQYQEYFQTQEKEIISLNEKLKRTKEQLYEEKINFQQELKKQQDQSQNIENEYQLQNDQLNQERRDLKRQLNKSNNELQNVQQKLEEFQEKSEKFSNLNQNNKKELEKKVQELREELDKMKYEKRNLNSEFINFKIEKNKEVALINQREEFNQKKINELRDTIESLENQNERNLRNIKKDLNQEIESQKKKFKDQLNNLEDKYLEKKRTLKETENKMNQKILELEKQKYSQNEKLQYYRSKVEELEKSIKSEQNIHSRDLYETRKNQKQEKEQYIKDIDQLRRDKYDLEIQLAETQAKYDKDKAVADGKIQFLDQQNKKLKMDLTEHQNNFDTMFQKFHQYRVADKEETESSHNAYIQQIEQRFNSQIQDIKEQNRIVVENLQEKLKASEREMKKLEQQNQKALDINFGSGIVQEKKISELLQQEKKLQQEILQLKEERDGLNLYYQKQIDKEKDGLKQKIQYIDTKFQKSCYEKERLQYDLEKNKTQWNIEKDKLLSEIDDKIEMIDILNKQKQQLSNENNKLKGNLKTLRKANFGLSFQTNKNQSGLFSTSNNKSGLGSQKNFYLDAFD